MQIKKEKFREYITCYEEDERFYRRLYEEEHLRPETFQTYIDSLDREYLKQRDLYVPAIHGSWFSLVQDNDLFHGLNQNITVCKHNRYSPEFIHDHQFYEVFYVYEGYCENTIQGNRRTYCTGDICILPPKTSHSIAVFDDSIILNIMIKASAFHSTFFTLFTGHNELSRFFSHIFYEKTENNYLLFHTGNDSVIRSLIEDIFIEYIGHQKYYLPLLDSLLMNFWVILMRRHEDHMESFMNTHTDLKILDILNYFQEHYRDVTLSSAAEHFGFSTPHFSSLVKENTGQTFVQIIREIKLEQARRALSTTPLTITAICELIGYDNPEHFSRVFKKYCGMTPGEYRKKTFFPSSQS